MRIVIQARDVPLTESLRAHVERRVSFALARYQNRVQQVTVCLSRTGAEEKRCRLRVRLFGLPAVVIDDTEADLSVAAERAAERAGRTLGRRLRLADGGLADGFVES